MELEFFDYGEPGPQIDLQGKSVVDVGGGPVSMLLKTRNPGILCVIDPCPFPPWVAERYRAADILYWRTGAENPFPTGITFDEAWMYNVLQHVENPELVCAQVRDMADFIRVFEWIEIDPHPGHPHRLEAAQLSRWLGGHGHAGFVNEGGAIGQAFWGTFPVR